MAKDSISGAYTSGQCHREKTSSSLMSRYGRELRRFKETQPASRIRARRKESETNVYIYIYTYNVP